MNNEIQHERLNELCLRLQSLHLGGDVANANLGKLARDRHELCAEFGFSKWFIQPEYGGVGFTPEQLIQGYLQVSRSCLATAFVNTQWAGAVSRIATSENQDLKSEVLPLLACGDLFATVGISHLTTSHRHLRSPVLRAEQVNGGFRLNGFSPWVTGVTFADAVVIGATVDSGDEVLLYVPTDLKGVIRPAPQQLVALNDSCTGRIELNQVEIGERYLIAGPMPQIMTQGKGGNTGGLQTSTLALGLSGAAIDYIRQECRKRPEFEDVTSEMEKQLGRLTSDLLALTRLGNREATTEPESASPQPGCASEKCCTGEELRANANSLVLRSTQAALMVAKGAGFCEGHPVGRWCQQALFFLVWSCPQPVAESNLCELAQIDL